MKIKGDQICEFGLKAEMSVFQTNHASAFPLPKDARSRKILPTSVMGDLCISWSLGLEVLYSIKMFPTSPVKDPILPVTSSSYHLA